MNTATARHIISVSGGKDSAALAIYMHNKIPNLEYVFCDTEKELRETYEYLQKLETFLGKPIIRLKHDGRGFDHWLSVYGGYLPSQRARWCTRHLKLQPFEHFIGDDTIISYVGIRADENNREGYVSAKPNIIAKYPFVEDGIGYEDVIHILMESGIGLPEYRSWRSRSGCYFCFFQKKIEWIGLLENHPDLFELASNYEKTDESTGKRFTWCGNESLIELAKPDRVAQIKADYEVKKSRLDCKSIRLADIFDVENEGPEACLICTL